MSIVGVEGCYDSVDHLVVELVLAVSKSEGDIPEILEWRGLARGVQPRVERRRVVAGVSFAVSGYDEDCKFRLGNL